MSVKLERFDDVFPYDLAEITFRHRRGINVRGAASSVLLNILANGLYASGVHDCTLLRTRKGHAPYLVGCVAEIVAAFAAQRATKFVTRERNR